MTSLCCARFDAVNLCRTLLKVTFVQSVHWLAHVQLDFAADVAPIDNDSMSGNVTLLLLSCLANASTVKLLGPTANNCVNPSTG